MKVTVKAKAIMKKMIAVTLGITMAFGALSLPDSVYKDKFSTASAYTAEVDNCKFSYDLIDRTGEQTIKITDVQFTGDTVEIPSVITHEGTEYPVTEIKKDFLRENNQVKTVIIPDSVTYINEFVLYSSSVQKIVLSNNLTHLGSMFAANCFSLKSLDCKSTNITDNEMGSCILYNNRYLRNEKGAICLGNWLIDYEKPENADVTEIKIADLGNDGIKITGIANSAVYSINGMKTLDLEGIKYIGSSVFSSAESLRYIINADDVCYLGDYALTESQWLKEAKENNIATLGSVLIYYKTDDKVIDLTKKNIGCIKSVARNALADCNNATTLLCTSDCMLITGCFYVNYDQSGENESIGDPMPKIPTYKIKDIYLDGEKLEFNKNDPEMSYWIKKNYYALKGSEWLKINCEKKAEELFKQLDLPFYRVNNDKVGTLSTTEEFYAALKVHDYLSTYNYDHNKYNIGALDAFLCGGLVNCSGYAEMTDFLLECAGVKCITLSSGLEGNHAWNEIRIGNDWYEWDNGWDEQSNHTYGWMGLSSENVARISTSTHNVKYTEASWHNFEKIDRIIAERVIGDINADTWRNDVDSQRLWAYLKGEDVKIDETAADINYDGVIDITDAVLLENIVNGHAVDPDNFPTDGLAPGFKVAFVNGKDYDNIKYASTDRDGYIVLPDDTFEAPEGKKLSYDIGKVGQKVKIHNPYQVIQTKWIDASESDQGEPGSSKNEDKFKLGDVNGDRTIDIEDAVAIIQHINGLTPLKEEEEKRADVSKDDNIDIDDAVILISYINGNSTF